MSAPPTFYGVVVTFHDIPPQFNRKWPHVQLEGGDGVSYVMLVPGICIKKWMNIWNSLPGTMEAAFIDFELTDSSKEKMAEFQVPEIMYKSSKNKDGFVSNVLVLS